MSVPFEFSWEWLPLANEGCQPYVQPLLLALSAAVGAAALFLIIRVKRSLSKRKEAKQLGTQSPPPHTNKHVSLSLWCGLFASCKISVLSKFFALFLLLSLWNTREPIFWPVPFSSERSIVLLCDQWTARASASSAVLS